MLPETPPTPSPSGRRRRHPSRQNVRRPGLVLQFLRRSFIEEKLNPEPFLGSLLRCRSHECASRLGSQQALQPAAYASWTGSSTAWGQARSLGIAAVVALSVECLERRTILQIRMFGLRRRFAGSPQACSGESLRRSYRRQDLVSSAALRPPGAPEA